MHRVSTEESEEGVVAIIEGLGQPDARLNEQNKAPKISKRHKQDSHRLERPSAGCVQVQDLAEAKTTLAEKTWTEA